MVATVEKLEQIYDKFNELFYGNELPNDVPIYLHDSLKILGRYDFTINEEGEVIYQAISISRSFDWEEKQLEDVMAHEMLHEYIYYFEIEEEPHGPKFIEWMNAFNRKFGTNIQVKQDLSQMKPLQGTSKLKWWFARTF